MRRTFAIFTMTSLLLGGVLVAGAVPVASAGLSNTLDRWIDRVEDLDREINRLENRRDNLRDDIRDLDSSRSRERARDRIDRIDVEIDAREEERRALDRALSRIGIDADRRIDRSAVFGVGGLGILTSRFDLDRVVNRIDRNDDRIEDLEDRIIDLRRDLRDTDSRRSRERIDDNIDRAQAEIRALRNENRALERTVDRFGLDVDDVLRADRFRDLRFDRGDVLRALVLRELF